MYPLFNITSSSKTVLVYEGWNVQQTTYRVNRKICCYIEEYKDKWRVGLGKPTDNRTECWYYPKTTQGKTGADKQIQDIIQKTISKYKRQHSSI